MSILGHFIVQLLKNGPKYCQRLLIYFLLMLFGMIFLFSNMDLLFLYSANIVFYFFCETRFFILNPKSFIIRIKKAK